MHHTSSACSAADSELLNNVQIFDHLAELFKRDLAVEVFVCLDDGTVHKLLQLDIVQVVADHHLEHLEQFTVGNVPVIVDVVDLEGEAQLLFLAGAGRQGVETLNELEERDVTVLVFIKYSNDTLHQRILRQLRDVEKFLGLEGTVLVLVNLGEVLVQLLQLLLSEVEVLKLLLLFSQLCSHD